MGGQTKDKGREWGFRSGEQLTGIKIAQRQISSVMPECFMTIRVDLYRPLDYVLIAAGHASAQKRPLENSKSDKNWVTIKN